MTQKELLAQVCNDNPDAIIIGSIGSICYDLSEIEHRGKIYIRGAMGAAMSCGLGHALGNIDKHVIVLIGDGSFLMKQGSLSTISNYNLPNLEIIIINNNQYKSCGGQKTNFKWVKDYLPKKVQVYDVI